MKFSKIMMLGLMSLMVCRQSAAFRIENQTMKPFTVSSVVETTVSRLINGKMKDDLGTVSIDIKEVKPGQAVNMKEETDANHWFSIADSRNFMNISKSNILGLPMWSGSSDAFSAEECNEQGCVIRKPRR